MVCCAVVLAGHAGAAVADRAAGWEWSAAVSPGYDTFVQRYALALEDTVESVERVRPGASAPKAARPRAAATTGRCGRGCRPDRSARAAGSTGSTPCGPTRSLPSCGSRDRAQAVRYNDATTYNLSSDHAEGALSARWQLARRGAAAWEARASAATLRYAEPSELEPRRNDWSAGFAAVSGAGTLDRWRAGLKYGRRSYPDTTEIDRRTLGADFSWSHDPLDGITWRLRRAQRAAPGAGQRRAPVRLEPHDGRRVVGARAAPLRAVAAASLEGWRYDDESGAYADQTRLEIRAAARAGGIFGPQWELGAVHESLASHAGGESYRQWGGSVALENYGEALTFLASLEVGRRDYDEAGADDRSWARCTRTSPTSKSG